MIYEEREISRKHRVIQDAGRFDNARKELRCLRLD